MGEQLEITSTALVPSVPLAVQQLEQLLPAGVTDPSRATSLVQRTLLEQLSANTYGAYRADLADWAAYCGRAARELLPPESEGVRGWLAEREQRMGTPGLERGLSALRQLCLAAGLPGPKEDPQVQAWMAHHLRTRGSRAPKRPARALLRADLLAMLDALERPVRSSQGMNADVRLRYRVRDRALLIIGWLSGVRASELCGLDLGDVQVTGEGLVLTVRRSKTDQQGEGKTSELARGPQRVCPVVAWQLWSAARGEAHGPAFTSLARGSGEATGRRLDRHAVRKLLLRHAAAAGLEGFSPHSLRAGVATQMHREGVNAIDIREHVGWGTLESVARYVRRDPDWKSNPTRGLLGG